MNFFDNLTILSKYIPATAVVMDRLTPKDGGLPLPLDVKRHICSFLRPEDLAQFSLVSRDCRVVRLEVFWDKVWDRLSTGQYSLSYDVIDEQAWRQVDCNRYGLNLAGASVPDNQTLKTAIWKMSKLVEGDAGATLILIPEGLTLNTVSEIAQDKGISISISCEEAERLRDKRVEKSRLVLISNAFLSETRKRSAEDQQKRCAQFGYELPDVLTVMALLVFKYPKGLCNEKNDNLVRFLLNINAQTRCSDKFSNEHFIVGSSCLTIDSNRITSDFLGALAFKKF